MFQWTLYSYIDEKVNDLNSVVYENLFDTHVLLLSSLKNTLYVTYKYNSICDLVLLAEAPIIRKPLW